MIKSYLNKRISPLLAITIIIILAVILIGGIIAYQYYLAPKEKPGAEVEEGIKFRLIDGDTGQPIANQKIFICDDSVEIDYVGEYPLSRFCDGENRKIITEVFTDSTGVLVLDVKKINVRPSFSIVFDTGDSDDWRGIVSVERSDSLAHTFHSSYIRVVNMERDGHVISNRLYNLDSKEVKEIFTSDDSEKTYTFDVIELTVFRKEAKEYMPNIVLHSKNEVIKLAYDSTAQTYKKQASYKFEYPLKYGTPKTIAILGDSIFVTAEEGILRLNNNLQKEKEFKINNIGSLTVSDEHVFISADGFFFVFDKDLKELSRIDLNVTASLTGEKKSAHDILVYDNIAYLLDNIMLPIYVLRVNVENPKNIEIIDSTEVWGIYIHLENQWLNPELDQWIVIESTGGQYGSSDTARIYSMSDGKEKAIEEIYSFSWTTKKGEGTRISAVTPSAPAWAIVLKNGYHLAKIKTEDDKIQFSNVLPLEFEEKAFMRGHIKRFENYLFIIHGKSLRIIDIEQQPKIVLSQELDEYVGEFVLMAPKH